MFYVYILRNPLNDARYVGFSEDLKARVSAHTHKSVKTTKAHAALVLDFYAAFRQKHRALAFESYLKRGSGHAFANKHLVSET